MVVVGTGIVAARIRPGLLSKRLGSHRQSEAQASAVITIADNQMSMR